MKVRRLLITSTALFALLPSAALAAGAKVQDPPRKIKFDAAAGEINKLKVTREGADVVFTDSGGGTIDAGASCTAVSPSSVRCPVPDGYRVDVDLGDGDDEVIVESGVGHSVDGGEGNDALTGGDGADDLQGGAGNDVISGGLGTDDVDGGDGDDSILVRDAVRDVVLCGLGNDTGEADLEDELNADCEGVQKPLAPPTITDPATTVEPVEPEAGKSVAATVKTGAIKVKLPGSTWTVLDPTQPVPVGTTLDATRGTLTLTSLADDKGTTQTANVTGARFVVAQKKGARMYTELRLTGGDFSSCFPSARAAGTVTARAAGKRRVRRLWGNGHGRFVTKGRNSAATVRGTVWSVEDRCDGTVTRVARGLVAVRDFTRGRTKLVRKGEMFFAPRRVVRRR